VKVYCNKVYRNIKYIAIRGIWQALAMVAAGENQNKIAL